VNRRTFLAGLSGGLLAAPLPAHAQQKKKLWRIGFVCPRREPRDRCGYVQPFLLGLGELGHVEGQDVILEYRDSDGEPETLIARYRELVAGGVDILLVGANPAVVAARQATSTVPIVMAIGLDPVGAGFAGSLAHPGGNVTGVTFDATPETTGKNVQLLKEAVPSISRLGLLSNPTFSPATVLPYRRAAHDAAQKLRLTVQDFEARTVDELQASLASISRARVNGLVVLGDVMLFTHREQIISFAARQRLPTMYPWRTWVDDGGLMSYGVNLGASYRETAAYVDKIIKGAKPADLPIEQPTKFELVVNLKTAKALGLTIPPSVLGRADELIQ
jgi:putative ABC transport system substrate-binding protein